MKDTRTPQGCGVSDVEASKRLSEQFPKLPYSVVHEVRLDEAEQAALGEFIRQEHKGRLSEGEALKLLVRDALIGLGLLALGSSNRSRGAKR